MGNVKEENINKILNQLFSKPLNKFHIRELSRLTGLNPNTVTSAIGVLAKQGIVIRQEKKHIVEVTLNYENKLTTQKSVNLFQIAVQDF